MSQARGRVILAITGASGAILGIRTLELLRKSGKETHLIIRCISFPVVRNNSNVRMPNMAPLAPVIARMTRPCAWLIESPLFHLLNLPGPAFRL